MSDLLNIQHQRLLERNGYQVVQLSAVGSFITVIDPVQCYSGKRRWVEERHATMRSPEAVYHFLNERK